MKITGLLHRTHPKPDSQLASLGRGHVHRNASSCPGPHTHRGNRPGATGPHVCASLSSTFPPLFIYCCTETLPYSSHQCSQPFREDAGAPLSVGCCLANAARFSGALPRCGQSHRLSPRSRGRWPPAKNFVRSAHSPLRVCSERTVVLAGDPEKDMWFTGDTHFSIFIFSHDVLNILLCDQNPLTSDSYLTYCKCEMEGCRGAYLQGWG